MRRIFIAIPLPIAIQEEIGKLITKLKKFSWTVKWEPREKMHITLRFLGYLGDAEIKKIDTLIARVAEKHKKVELQIDGFVAFPNFRFPRIIGLKISNYKELNQLQSSIAKIIDDERIGKAEIHKFTGHITLGRMASAPVNLKALSTIKFNRVFTARSIDVIESVLSPSGSDYFIISSYTLKDD